MLKHVVYHYLLPSENVNSHVQRLETVYAVECRTQGMLYNSMRGLQHGVLCKRCVRT